MDSMITSIINIESFISIITILIILASMIMFISNRAGSSFGIINKIINIIYSSKGFHSNEIDNIWREREDVERFNAIFNMRAEHLSHIFSFHEWIKKLNLDLKLVSRTGVFFDIKKRKIKKSPWYLIATVGVAALLFFALAIFLFMLTISNAALIKMHKFENIGWFWINNERAYSASNPFYNDNEWRLTKSSCEDKINESDLPDDFRNLICDSFNKKSFMDYMSELISTQNKMLVPALLIAAFTVFFNSTLNKSLRANRARLIIRDSILSYRRGRQVANGSCQQEDGQEKTWTGQGGMPKAIAEQVVLGKNLDDFLI